MMIMNLIVGWNETITKTIKKDYSMQLLAREFYVSLFNFFER